MAITDKEQGVWELEEVYNKINQGDIWEYNAMDPYGLFIWGANRNGELGLNQGSPPWPQYNISSPTQIPGSNWNQGAQGRGSLTIGVKSDNTLWAWGSNGDGGVGDNTSVQRSSPTQIGTGTDWKHMGVGENHGLCTKTDGTLWAWGKNGDGQSGQNNKTTYSSPIQIPGTTWDKGYANAKHAAATKTDGTLWTWGGGAQGALGLNSNTERSSPMQVPGVTWNEVVCSGKGFIATKTDGTLWMTGNNEFGAAGQNVAPGTVGNYSSPIQIGTGTDWSLEGNAINSNTQGQSFAIKTDGTLWSWGLNGHAQLGQNNRTNYSSPTQIPGTTWKNVASAYYTTQAVKTDGTMWTWGYNGNGDLGLNQGEPTRRSSPVQVPGTDWFGCQGSSDYNFTAFLNN